MVPKEHNALTIGTPGGEGDRETQELCLIFATCQHTTPSLILCILIGRGCLWSLKVAKRHFLDEGVRTLIYGGKNKYLECSCQLC